MKCHYEEVLSLMLDLAPSNDQRDILRRQFEGVPQYVFECAPPHEAHEWAEQLIVRDAFTLPGEYGAYFECPTQLEDTGEDVQIAQFSLSANTLGSGRSPPQSYFMYPAACMNGTWVIEPGALVWWSGVKGWRIHHFDPSWDKEPRAAQCTSENIGFLIRFAALLTFKGTERQIVRPSRQVRRAAERKGVVAAKAYTVLRIPPKSHTAEAKDGTHASPKPHFRRGHVRRVTPGRLLKVRPAWVMAETGTPPTVSVKLS